MCNIAPLFKLHKLMNKAIKNTLTVALVILVASFFYIGAKSTSTDLVKGEKQIIKIGVSAPLTGDLAFLGEGLRNSILLAASSSEDLKHSYQVVIEDDSFNPSKAVSSVNKLINVDKVDVLITMGSPVGNAISPIAEAHRIPHLNAIASDPNVAKGDYNFVHWTPPAAEAAKMLAELQARNIKNFAILVQNQPGTLAVARELETQSRAAQSPVRSLLVAQFNSGEKDFRTQIEKVRILNPEIYVFISTSPELEILAKQMRSSGIKTPFTSIESFEFTDQMSLFEGDWYVNASDPTQKFIDQYKSVYGKNPTLGSANAYDLINLIKYVGEKQSSPTKDSIKGELYNVKDYEGAVGNIYINKDGIVVSNPTIRQIVEGKPVTIEK